MTQGARLCHVAAPGEEDSGGPPEPGGQAGHDPPLAAPREQGQRPGAARGAGVQPAEPGELPGEAPRPRGRPVTVFSAGSSQLFGALSHLEKIQAAPTMQQASPS